MRVHLVWLDEDRAAVETAISLLSLPCAILIYLLVHHSTREGLAVSWRELLEDLPFLLLGLAVAWGLGLLTSAVQMTEVDIPPIERAPAPAPASSEAQPEPSQSAPRVVPIAPKREVHRDA